MAQEGEATESLDLRERGLDRHGEQQVLDRRLFMQLLVFEWTGDTRPSELPKRLGSALDRHHAPGVVYEDVNHPYGFGLLSWSEDPSDFVNRVRPALGESGLEGLELRPEFSMLGRSYSTGFEPDLEHWLLERPRATVLNEAWPWALWYPLRRTGAFERLEARERGGIMREHSGIGRSYGAADLAHDVRLACHGLDVNDNEFVIGLIGKNLHPLSHVVQAMRATRQTAEFMQQMGPFFVGRAVLRRAE